MRCMRRELYFFLILSSVVQNTLALLNIKIWLSPNTYTAVLCIIIYLNSKQFIVTLSRYIGDGHVNYMLNLN